MKKKSIIVLPLIFGTINIIYHWFINIYVKCNSIEGPLLLYIYLSTLILLLVLNYFFFKIINDKKLPYTGFFFLIGELVKIPLSYLICLNIIFRQLIFDYFVWNLIFVYVGLGFISSFFFFLRIRSDKQPFKQ